ncbi:aspartate dehydrogenase [Cochlodiniinecator piscidefendens]|uniref:aspartate dehydrogenase n=1 Tax=Cochlodiniinecator piscidefendens TaxID=2715756 RepID=UPI001408ACE5|nr:aspartate dehydrogenase [Cochlodiniinecator piscidefendens]
MPHFEFNHISVAYSDTGTGSALLLIPGLGGQLAFWAGITEVLKRDFRVISFDYPGSGGSADFTGHISLDDFADMAFALLDHLAIDQVQVIGQSMGGTIAQIMTLSCPKRVSKLILSSTWVASDAAFERGFNLRHQILTELGLEAYAKAQVLAVMNAEQIAKDPQRATQWEQKTINTSTPDALSVRIEALMGFDNVDRVSQIKQPTLVIGTEDDQVVPIHMSKRLAHLVPNAELKILPDGGHFLPMTAPGTYLELVLPFLREERQKIKPVSVLLIGAGSIGQHIIDAICDVPGVEIQAVLVRPERETYYAQHLPTGVTVASDVAQLEGLNFDFAVECAGHDGLRQFGADVLRAGINLGILSAGAMLDASTVQSLETAALTGGARIKILSGALAGVDALCALAGAGLETVHLISRKPPSAWRGSVAEQVLDLKCCTAPVTLFQGSAREAAQLYPKNANVSAIAALNGLGPDKTEITLIADPDIRQNSHNLVVKGAFGSFTTVLHSDALPDNPRSSAAAALSAIAAIKAQRTGFIH